MEANTRNSERGVALFFSIFALLLVTAIGAALIFEASTETSINSNFRQEETAYFGAKAGIEEARARMMASDPNTLYVKGDATHPLLDPALVAAPTTANNMIYYIVNNGSVANSVLPWGTTTAVYADDELCHDGYGLGLIAEPPDIRCPLLTTPFPTGGYVAYNSTLPFNGTKGAMPFKWVRIAPKLNGSVAYLQGSGGTATTSTYMVNSSSATTVKVNGVSYPVTFSASTPICWDGQEETPLTFIAGVITNCNQMTSTANLYAGAPMTNVYVITALGVSSNASNAARKVVQSEVALAPAPPFKYGLFATSAACPAISFTGQNPSTDAYSTANGGTYATTENATQGDIGTNGGVAVQNGNVGGIVGVLQPPPLGSGTCPTPVTMSGGGKIADGGSASCPSGNWGGFPVGTNPAPSSCFMSTPYVFPPPPAPNPAPPDTAAKPATCNVNGNKVSCFAPGTYGNINVNGTLYLAPGTYNVNSLTMQGNGAIIVYPAGAVTLNVAGGGSAASQPLKIDGNGITDTPIPNDFIINYAGNGNIAIAGNGNVTAQLDAPNASIAQQGNGNWYGSIVASTMTIGGNAFFHYDTNAALAPANNGFFTMVGYRTVPY